MKETREPLSIRSPTKVGAGVDGPRRRVIEPRALPGDQKAAEDTRDRLFSHRQRWFAAATPDLLIRIREHRIDDLAEARSRVSAIFLAELFRGEVLVRHGPPGMSCDSLHETVAASAADSGVSVSPPSSRYRLR